MERRFKSNIINEFDKYMPSTPFLTAHFPDYDSDDSFLTKGSNEFENETFDVGIGKFSGSYGDDFFEMDEDTINATTPKIRNEDLLIDDGNEYLLGDVNEFSEDLDCLPEIELLHDGNSKFSSSNNSFQEPQEYFNSSIVTSDNSICEYLVNIVNVNELSGLDKILYYLAYYPFLGNDTKIEFTDEERKLKSFLHLDRNNFCCKEIVEMVSDGICESNIDQLFNNYPKNIDNIIRNKFKGMENEVKRWRLKKGIINKKKKHRVKHKLENTPFWFSVFLLYLSSCERFNGDEFLRKINEVKKILIKLFYLTRSNRIVMILFGVFKKVVSTSFNYTFAYFIFNYDYRCFEPWKKYPTIIFNEYNDLIEYYKDLMKEISQYTDLVDDKLALIIETLDLSKCKEKFLKAIIIESFNHDLKIKTKELNKIIKEAYSRKRKREDDHYNDQLHQHKRQKTF